MQLSFGVGETDKTRQKLLIGVEEMNRKKAMEEFLIIFLIRQNKIYYKISKFPGVNLELRYVIMYS